MSDWLKEEAGAGLAALMSGDAKGAASSAARVALGKAGARVAFRTQMTPDMIVDLSAAAEPSPPREPGASAVVVEWLLANVVKPEITVEIAGASRTIAPWGRPTRNIAPIIAIAAVAGAAGAGYAGWQVWQKWKRKGR